MGNSYRSFRYFSVGVSLIATLSVASSVSAQVKAPAGRGELTNRGGYNRVTRAGNDTVMAQVGQILSADIPIRTKPNNSSPLLFRVPKGTNVAVVTDNGMYWGVLMADRTIAWIKKTDVELLDYNVEMASPIVPPAADDNPPPLTPGDTPGAGSTDITRFTANLSGTRQAILQEAAGYQGVPYVWGGTRRSGLDCSGFVMNVFSTVGVELPRVSSSQAQVGRAVVFEELQPGDRIYFDCNPNRPGVDHTGIYIGDGYLIHASGGRHKVVIEKLTTAYWRSHFVTGRRDFE